MKNLIKLILLLIFSFVLSACEGADPTTTIPDGPIVINPGINTSPIIYADQTSVTNGVSFSTKGAWESRITDMPGKSTTKTASDWISISPSSGSSAGNHTVQITMDENLTGATRKARIEFICANSIIEITVEQKEVTQSGEPLDKDRLVILTPKNLTFLQSGGEEVAMLEPSTDWSASVDVRAIEWLSISTEKGTVKDSVIVISAQPNRTPDERNGSITIKSGRFTETITVSQKQKDALTISSSKIEIPNSQSNFDVEVSANIQFDVEVKDSWIHQIQSKAMTTTKLSFVADENDGEELRQGRIIIKSGASKDTVNVYQSARNIFVLSKTEHFITDVGGDIAIEIKSNVPYEVTMPSDTWIKESVTRAISSHTRYFTIEPNTDHSSRKTTLIFASTDGSGLSEQVTINQAQKDALVVSADTIYTDSDAKVIEIETNSNVEYMIETGAPWIGKIATKALQKRVVSFNIGANFGKERRTGKIIFGNGTISQTVVVSQAPNGPEMPDVLEGEIEIPVAGTLKDIITQYELCKYTKLKLKGHMNQEDVAYFDCSATPFQIKELDLSQVTFVDDKIDGFNYLLKLHTVKLPESLKILGAEAFNDCAVLTNIDLGLNPQLERLLGGRRANMWRGHWPVGAFRNCKLLESFTIPATVTTIEAGIFTGCEALKAINFAPNCKISIIEGLIYSYSNGVLSFYDKQGFFEGCKSLKTVTLPSSIEAIGEATFKGSAIEHIEIPSTVNAINPKGLFLNCKNLISAKLPSVVTAIGEDMFRNCESLKTFTFEGGVKSIGAYGLSGCKQIESFPLEKLESIGDYAFAGSGFKSFVAHSSLTKIPVGLFKNCEQLTSIDLNQVVEIGGGCFTGCTALRSVTIPSTVAKIGGGAFSSCTSLEEFKLTGGDITFESEILSESKLTEFIIPSAITSIVATGGLGGNINKITFEPNSQCRIFDGVCQSLGITSITIPESVIELGGITSCEKLTEVKGMKGVTKIKDQTFGRCKQLTSIELPSSLRVIGDGVFGGSGIKTLVIPEGVEVVGELYSYSLGSLLKLTKLVLPSTLKEFKGVPYAPYLYECVINGGDLKLGKRIFEGCPMMNKIVIGKGVRSIDSNNLTGTISSENITSIEFEQGSVCKSISKCFAGTQLDELKLPESIEVIGDYTFAGASIKNLVIPSGVKTIGAFAFSNCKDLKLTKLNSVETIMDRAFEGCSLITKLELPAQLTKFNCNSMPSTLTELIIHAPIPPTFVGPSFKNPSICTLKVPRSSIESYKAKLINWQKLKAITAIQ